MQEKMPTDERGALLSRLLVNLYKGVLYREGDEALWSALLDLRGAVADHFAQIGVDLVVDEDEGYAYLRYPPGEEEDECRRAPRLIARRQLSYDVSLMLALLRRRVAEFDASGDGVRLVLSHSEIVEMMRHSYPEMTDEVKFEKFVARHIVGVEGMGFLRALKGASREYEVCRIIKAFIDGQWLGELDKRLERYRMMREENR